MKIWIDDMRPAPEGYVWSRSVNETKIHICQLTRPDGTHNIEILDMDHDAGDCSCFGGDYIKILDWMEQRNINDIPIHIHSQNPVGVANMRAIIKRNNWKEVL